jgi:type IV pilus assembly protein PilW
MGYGFHAMNKNSRRGPGRMHGFSLIELMIAMTIGLVISLVVGQLFLGSRAAFTSTDNLSRVQENSRYALSVVSRELRSASYRSDPRVPRPTAYPVATTPSLTGVDGGGTASDQITVRFQGSGTTTTADGTMQDCVGNRIVYGTVVVNTFLIQNDPNNNNEPTLFCNTLDPSNACVAATCFALVPGVENMQILYGEDTGAQPFTTNPDGSIDRWVGAGSVSNWDNVLSVRISLLLRTDDRVGQTKDTRAYAMSGTSVSAPGNDTRLRRVYTSVINLRNRTQ